MKFFRTPRPSSQHPPVSSSGHTAPSPDDRLRRSSERLPVVCLILYGIGLIALICYIVMMHSVAFADWMNVTVSAFLRSVFSLLTSWIPFSVGEFLILTLPITLFLTLRYAIRHRSHSMKATLSFVGIVLSVVVTIFSIFSLNFAAGYRSTPLADKLELRQEKVSAEELYDTTVWLRDCINRETADITFAEGGFSERPFTLTDMNAALNRAYKSFSETHGFISHTPSRVKPVLSSEIMSYMHITGVYSFFTGEANINVRFPDYTIPYTAAHEMAHQRGIAREDEANFMAFLICLESDDPYIRYSGYLNVYEYVSSALWRADHDLYYKATAHLNPEVKGEMAAYNRFFEKYRESTASKVSSSVNNSYLQSQGTVGTRSYGMVVDLAVAYFQKNIAG